MNQLVIRPLINARTATSPIGHASQGRGLGITGLGITIRDIRKSFGANDVLRGIDLTIAAGEFVTIVGRSGCGKSTLLRLLVGLDQPTSGAFWFGDSDEKSAQQQDIRVMFQEPRLLPWARVLSNVEVGLGADRKSPDARERALATLREVGLEERRDDWPSILSGGQK